MLPFCMQHSRYLPLSSRKTVTLFFARRCGPVVLAGARRTARSFIRTHRRMIGKNNEMQDRLYLYRGPADIALKREKHHGPKPCHPALRRSAIPEGHQPVRRTLNKIRKKTAHPALRINLLGMTIIRKYSIFLYGAG